MGTEHEDRVCTYRDAEEAIRRHPVAFVNDCFCRGPAKAGKAPYPYCGHPVRTCMGFKRQPDAKFAYEEIPQARALEMLEDWKKQGLFFRAMADGEWLCFCCPCGCGWFRDKHGNRVPDGCDKSGFIEQTDAAACNLCGKCVPVCAYQARKIEDGKMAVAREQCYGCSACEFACPEKAIKMVARA